jgi:phenylalanyl-tRNA synthetase beta chain
MRAPLSWIRDFTPVEGSLEEIARTLSFLGLVVEGTEEIGPALPGIVVAHVLATRPHPSADRIHLVDVDVGDGEALQICCGAFNMKAGDLVPLATLGTVMPSGLEIGRRKLRGEWSNGMLCSALELGLGPEGPAPAIYLLPPGAGEPGQALADVLGFGEDIVFDLEVSPNRGDCLCVAGVARDLAAGLRAPFAIPEPRHVVSEGVERAQVAVDGDAAGLCPRFTGTVIEGVADAMVAPLVARRLALAGMRPISPVVDVSNYVMLELGQPNHPYDLDRLAGRGLNVRRGRPGEEIVTLDGAVRRLSPKDCVIADATGAGVGVGGIMGGAAAEISAATTTVLLEAANFSPEAISSTGKRLGLNSEARARFERGVDIELAPRAVDRFVELLGPRVLRGPTADVRAASAPPPPVVLRTERVNLVLGTSLSPSECAELIAPLGFEATPAEGTSFEVKVPTWRRDCSREVDLIEEVARAHGYDNIARTLPERPFGGAGLTDYQKGRRRARELMAGSGADEAWTSTFLSEADLDRAGLESSPAVRLENPLDQSQGLLRTALLPGLLQAVRFNRERQAGALSLFEIGRVFRVAPPEGPQGLVEGVLEWEQLGLVAVGDGVDAAYAVRAWQVLAGGTRVSGPAVVPWPGPTVVPWPGPTVVPWPGPTGTSGAGTGALAVAGSLHPGRRAAVVGGGQVIGVVGELAPELAERHDLTGRVAVLLVDLAGVLGAVAEGWQIRPASRYPASDLDMAFFVGDDVVAGALEATLREAAGELAEEVGLFDVWRDASRGRRSLAFRARLRAPDRTLTDPEVAEMRERAAAAALERHGAVLRRA